MPSGPSVPSTRALNLILLIYPKRGLTNCLRGGFWNRPNEGQRARWENNTIIGSSLRSIVDKLPSAFKQRAVAIPQGMLQVPLAGAVSSVAKCLSSPTVYTCASTRIHPKAWAGRTHRARGSQRTCPVGVFKAKIQRTKQRREKLTCTADPLRWHKHKCQACQWRLSRQISTQADKRGEAGMSTLCPTQSQPHKFASQQTTGE